MGGNINNNNNNNNNNNDKNLTALRKAHTLMYSANGVVTCFTLPSAKRTTTTYAAMTGCSQLFCGWWLNASSLRNRRKKKKLNYRSYAVAIGQVTINRVPYVCTFV